MKRIKHIYRTFFALTAGQSFYITRTKIAVKTGFCSCREITAKPTEYRIAPWRRVRTLIPVSTTGRFNDRRNVQNASPDFHYHGTEISPAVLARDPKDFQTHYVGDSCPGGHAGFHESYHGIDGAIRPVRDPLDQDHTPDQVPTHEQQRTL